MKNITDNSLWSKLTLLLNALLLVFFILSMVFLMKFDKTNVAVVAERPAYEKSYEDFVMAQHPLKQDSAEVAYYAYKLDTLTQKLSSVDKADRKALEDAINVTKGTLAEKKDIQAAHVKEIAEKETEYAPVQAHWDEINQANDKTKKGFVAIAIVTLIFFVLKIAAMATWNYKNSKNIHNAAAWMKSGMPAWMSYVGWIIPVYNLIKPVSFFKEIWEETDYILEDKSIVSITKDAKDTAVDNSGLHISIWWGLLLCSVWLMNIVLFLTFFREGAFFQKFNHKGVTIVAIVVLILCVLEEVYLILAYNKKNKMMVDNADKFDSAE